MRRFNLNDRPVPSGSMAPRLNPAIVADGLNRALPPRWPRPLVRATGGGDSVHVGNTAGRRRAIGLPGRFDKE